MPGVHPENRLHESDRYDFHELLAHLDDVIGWLNGIGISSQDRLWRYRQNIQRMMKAHEEGQVEHLQRTMPLDEAREIFSSYIEADEFVRALVALRPHDTPNLRDQIALALKGPADLFLEDENSNHGRNFAFELIVGGRLASAGFPPEYGGQPDVGFQFANLKMGIQCKRPLSEKKLERHIRAAINQIEAASAYHGIVAVSVSRIINPGNPGLMPEVENTEAGHEFLKARIRGIADASKRFWQEKAAPSAVGLYLYAFTPIRVQQPRHIAPFRYDLIVPISANPVHAEIMRCLVQAIN